MSHFYQKIIPNEVSYHKPVLVKLGSIQKDRKSLIRSRENQLRKMQNVIEKIAVKVNTGCQELFMKITNEEKWSIFDENSPQRFLWEEQKKQASYKNLKSVRWHPVFIRWCFAIYLKSLITLLEVSVTHILVKHG